MKTPTINFKVISKVIKPDCSFIFWPRLQFRRFIKRHSSSIKIESGRVFYHIPYWFEDCKYYYKAYSFDRIPEELKDEILNMRTESVPRMTKKIIDKSECFKNKDYEQKP